MITSLLDRHFGRSCGNHLSEGRMAIDLEDPPMVANDFRLCLWIDNSFLNFFQVLGDANEPIGIVSCKIGLGQVVRHDTGVAGRGSSRLHHHIGYPDNLMFSQYWHVQLLQI